MHGVEAGGSRSAPFAVCLGFPFKGILNLWMHLQRVQTGHVTVNIPSKIGPGTPYKIPPPEDLQYGHIWVLAYSHFEQRAGFTHAGHSSGAGRESIYGI